MDCSKRSKGKQCKPPTLPHSPQPEKLQKRNILDNRKISYADITKGTPLIGINGGKSTMIRAKLIVEKENIKDMIKLKNQQKNFAFNVDTKKKEVQCSLF
jgi:hypothetical protein